MNRSNKSRFLGYFTMIGVIVKKEHMNFAALEMGIVEPPYPIFVGAPGWPWHAVASWREGIPWAPQHHWARCRAFLRKSPATGSRVFQPAIAKFLMLILGWFLERTASNFMLLWDQRQRYWQSWCCWERGPPGFKPLQKVRYRKISGKFVFFLMLLAVSSLQM